MTLETAEDLAAFFDSDEFGSAATIAAVAAVGIFEDGYEATQALGYEVQGVAPRLLVKPADAAGVADGAPIVVGGVNYTLRRQEPDGSGLIALILTEA